MTLLPDPNVQIFLASIRNAIMTAEREQLLRTPLETLSSLQVPSDPSNKMVNMQCKPYSIFHPVLGTILVVRSDGDDVVVVGLVLKDRYFE